jgi:hypothetical protein
MQVGFPDNSYELNAQVDIYINVDGSVNKVVGLRPGLAFTGGAGVRDVSIIIFRTLVWGFR